jgi:hypothetical protein
MKSLGLSWLASAICVMATIGCGDSSRPTAPSTVRGVVTLDGQVLPEGVVNFSSSSTGDAAIAMVADGKFVVTGGMVPGTYKVSVTPPTPTPENPAPPVSKVPEKYRTPETTDLTSKITGGTNEVKLDLKS